MVCMLCGQNCSIMQDTQTIESQIFCEIDGRDISWHMVGVPWDVVGHLYFSTGYLTETFCSSHLRPKISGKCPTTKETKLKECILQMPSCNIPSRWYWAQEISNMRVWCEITQKSLIFGLQMVDETVTPEDVRDLVKFYDKDKNGALSRTGKATGRRCSWFSPQQNRSFGRKQNFVGKEGDEGL